MPLYEYLCSKCGNVFEVMQKFSDNSVTTHEGCGGAVERLISAPSFQFKGSGWYVTDYAKGNAGTKPDAKSEGKGDGKPESKGDSKGDSKAETKSDSKSESKPESKSESKPAPAAKTE